MLMALPALAISVQQYVEPTNAQIVFFQFFMTSKTINGFILSNRAAKPFSYLTERNCNG